MDLRSWSENLEGQRYGWEKQGMKEADGEISHAMRILAKLNSHQEREKERGLYTLMWKDIRPSEILRHGGIE